MYRIGLTGGIGSGKTEVADALRELGAHVVTADDVAREQTVPGSPVLGALVAEFGPGILRADGTLDRAGLGDLVFSSRPKLERLNVITHPTLVEGILGRVEDFDRTDPEGVVVLDAALLLEWDLCDAFDLVLAVRAPVELRLARLVSGGMTEESARARIGAQASDVVFAEAADVILDNDGSIEELRRKVREFWSRAVDGPGRENQ